MESPFRPASSARMTSAPAFAAPSRRSPTMCGFLRPPPQTIHSFGGSGRWSAAFRIASAETAASVRAPSASSSAPAVSSVKSLRSSDFGPDFSKNGAVQIALHHGADDAALAGDGAVGVVGHAALARHPLVDQRVAGTAVEGDRIAPLRHIGDVGNAADIDEHDRKPAGISRRQRAGERGVVGRHQRRALPAMQHVVGAHVVDDRHAGQRRQQARRRRAAPSGRPADGAARSGRGSR